MLDGLALVMREILWTNYYYKGIEQLIHKSSREVDSGIMAGLCATENHLCPIAYSKFYSILFPNEKNPYFIQTDTVPCKTNTFPASINSKCVYIIKFWPMWWGKQGCGASKKMLYRKSGTWIMTGTIAAILSY